MEKQIFEIDSACKPVRCADSTQIQFLGNNKLGWMLSYRSVIKRIENNLGEFLVYDNMMDKKLPLKSVVSKDGRKYLSAHDGNREWDTLLGLPSCYDCRLID